ncbi:hypothetical protein PBAL39_04348 [Pedobacter sp. BAL39]|uniref:hypothetical protein n=1 Tax=Pedobacter sp. BAL39 TaxID=391596 RepID=UPI0001559BC4|nr:hypothetical protein [Pedobacter sp. BAL39]EDM36998.1 hypothetical protein PBAL39_04348 [Pedobacter sp. BAL39]
MEELSTLSEVKSLILLKTGIRTITPADCKRISIEISKTLNKNVSETTIKRLFGFAVVKHNFSKFTLTTLSEYVNREESERWTLASGTGAPEGSTKWDDIRANAKRITEYTLKSVRNRSGIPYEMTISRKFAEHDLNDFFKSSFSFTCFISQPGYGKTILMSHLVEKFFTTKDATYQDSSALFLTVNNFYNQEQQSMTFEEQMKVQLKMNHKESLLEYIQNNYALTGRKFVIFLDGFSELIIKKDMKKQLFESITNFICAIENIDCIKLVMSMRSTTWMRFFDCIRHSAFLKSKWFPGNYFSQSDVSNVPPLTGKEVDMIISKVNPNEFNELSTKLKSQLKFPLYIQLYYQLKEEDPYFINATSITFHELISRFIQEKIYRSNYYTEKILFLKKVIQLTDYGKKEDTVPKNLLIAELSAFKNAYMELLSEGILMEEKSQDDYQPKEYVRFIYPHIFEYFLFIELLEKFHLQVDWHFFQHIQQTYENNNTRFHLLQWIIRFIIKIGDFKSLNHVFELQLDYFERNYLMLFIAENLRFRTRGNPDTLKLLTAQNLHETLTRQLINFDFVDSCYKDAVAVLAEITEGDEYKIIYQSILTVIDILSLNVERIAERLEIIQGISADDWPVKPYDVAILIYNKLTDRVQSHELLTSIRNSDFSFLDNNGPIDTKKGISYLMILLLNIFYGDDRGSILIIDKIARQQPGLFYTRCAFTIFICNILALSRSKAMPGKKTDQMERILVQMHRDKQRYKLTEYSASILKLMQANQLRLRGEFLLAYEYANDCIQIFKRNDLNLNCLWAYDIIIAIFKDLRDQGKVNEYKYEKICFMEDRDIPQKGLM